MVIEMDRDEKIARLEAWLHEHDHELRVLGPALMMNGDKRLYREYEAVRHELQRQIDKKIIEELGIFTEKKEGKENGKR